MLVQPSVYGFDHGYLHAALATAPERLRGVILADPADPNSATRIRQTVRRSAITGIRLLPIRAKRDWLGPQSETAWRCAAEFALVVTLLVSPAHFDAVARWAIRFADIPVVIDHLGRPDLSESSPADAIAELVQLSKFRNIHVKLSGIGALSHVPPPHKDMWNPIQLVADAFGPDRVMWGSDYPWLDKSKTINASLSSVSEALRDLSVHDAGLVFGGTARRLFKFPAQLLGLA